MVNSWLIPGLDPSIHGPSGKAKKFAPEPDFFLRERGRHFFPKMPRRNLDSIPQDIDLNSALEGPDSGKGENQ